MVKPKIDPRAVPQPLVWQREILAQPTSSWVALCGGRYSGKSHLSILLMVAALGPVELGGHGESFRGLILRSDLEGLNKLTEMASAFIQVLFRGKARWVKSERRFYLPNGATLKFSQLGDESSATRWQGQDYSWCLLDDAGLIHPDLVRRVITSLRTSNAAITPRLVVTANPGNRHSATWARLLKEAGHNATSGSIKPFQSREFGGKTWVVSKSNIFDNHALTREQRDDYVEILKARANGRKAVEQAEIYGSWDFPSGGFFASLDASRVQVPDGHFSSPRRYEWAGELLPLVNPQNTWLCADWGGGMSPSWVGLAVQLPDPIVLADGRLLGRDSMVLIDEFHTATTGLSGDLDVEHSNGQHDTATFTAGVFQMCKRWGIHAADIHLGRRIIDAAVGARTGSRCGSIANELAAEGLAWTPGPKGERSVGWSLMGKLFTQCGFPAPGLFVSERCEYWWLTVPVLPIHRNRLDDLEGPDHAADAVRYLAMSALGHIGGTMVGGPMTY
jgi:hypothetical protein